MLPLDDGTTDARCILDGRGAEGVVEMLLY